MRLNPDGGFHENLGLLLESIDDEQFARLVAEHANDITKLAGGSTAAARSQIIESIRAWVAEVEQGSAEIRIAEASGTEAEVAHEA